MSHITRRQVLRGAGALGATAATTLVLPDFMRAGLAGIQSIVNAPDLRGARVITSFPGGSGHDELGIGAESRGPEGPTALVARRDGSVAILDNLNKRVSIVRGGAVVDIIPLPLLDWGVDIEETGSALFILDAALGQVISIQGRAVTRRPIPGTLGAASRLVAGGAPGRIAVVEADGGAYDLDDGRPSASIHFPDGAGGRSHVEYGGGFLDRRLAHWVLPSGARVPIATNSFLASLVPLGRDDRGRSYALLTEIEIHNPGTDVDLTIHRFEPDGTPAGIARVPVRGRFSNPRRAVTFAPNGDAFALFTESSRTLLLQLGWQVRLVARPQPLHLPSLLGVALANTANVPVSRATARATAMSFTTQFWYATAQNLTAITQDCSGTAVTTQTPGYLVGTGAGWKQNLPYCWGGYAIVQGFLNEMNAGKMAGNVYATGNFKCGTAGDDCAGYVQQAYGDGAAKLNVQNLWAKYVVYGGTPAESGNLSTGDLFALLPNSHVRMHDIYANWNGQMYLGNYMFESAAAWQDRISYQYRTWAEYSGYTWGVASFTS